MVETTGKVTRQRPAIEADVSADADVTLAGFVIVKHGDGEVGLTRLEQLPRIEGWPENMGKRKTGED